MASYLNLMSPSIINLGMTSATKFTYGTGRCRAVTSKRCTSNLTIRAVQENGGPRRLVDIIRTVPELSRNYFRSPSRRALFGGISLLGGFYVAQTISLSFGALGVNDVIAAVICVLLTEYVTRFYYSRPKDLEIPVGLRTPFIATQQPHGLMECGNAVGVKTDEAVQCSTDLPTHA